MLPNSQLYSLQSSEKTAMQKFLYVPSMSNCALSAVCFDKCTSMYVYKPLMAFLTYVCHTHKHISTFMCVRDWHFRCCMSCSCRIIIMLSLTFNPILHSYRMHSLTRKFEGTEAHTHIYTLILLLYTINQCKWNPQWDRKLFGMVTEWNKRLAFQKWTSA